MTHERFHKNAPGDFYTTGECLACGVPEAEAPECLAPLDEANGDTYFLRQPQTDAEVERVCAAADTCCVNAIRYGGKDPAIIQRLGNRPDYCDHLLPGGPITMPGHTDQRWPEVHPAARPWWKFWK